MFILPVWQSQRHDYSRNEVPYHLQAWQKTIFLTFEKRGKPLQVNPSQHNACQVLYRLFELDFKDKQPVCYTWPYGFSRNWGWRGEDILAPEIATESGGG